MQGGLSPSSGGFFSPLSLDTPSLDTKAAAIQQAMITALDTFARPRKHAKMEVPWWTPKCSALLQAVKATTTQRT